MQKRKCELCKIQQSIYRIREKYGAAEKDVDEYIVCESCRKVEEKICRNWGYGFNAELLQKE